MVGSPLARPMYFIARISNVQYLRESLQYIHGVVSGIISVDHLMLETTKLPLPTCVPQTRISALLALNSSLVHFFRLFKSDIYQPRPRSVPSSEVLFRDSSSHTVTSTLQLFLPSTSPLLSSHSYHVTRSSFNPTKQPTLSHTDDYQDNSDPFGLLLHFFRA